MMSGIEGLTTRISPSQHLTTPDAPAGAVSPGGFKTPQQLPAQVLHCVREPANHTVSVDWSYGEHTHSMSHVAVVYSTSRSRVAAFVKDHLARIRSIWNGTLLPLR